MTSTSRKHLITQVKLDLKDVIENIRLLENSHITDEQQLSAVKKKTQLLLDQIGKLPLEKLNKTLKKQKKRRQRKKLKKKNIKMQAEVSQQLDQKAEIQLDLPLSTNNTNSPQHSQKSHHQLRSLYECQRFLKTFELLEQLHLARGQDPVETNKFSGKLRHLKSVWNSLLQEHQGEQTNGEHLIHQQWNEVLFGSEEKSYYEGKQNLKYFLRKRHIWDSYIDNKYGSSIPIGWVLPPLEPNDEWCQYLIK